MSLLVAVVAVAVSQAQATPRVQLPAGRIALLEPIISRAIFSDADERQAAYAAAARVHDRWEKECRGWDGWSAMRPLKRKETVEATRYFAGPQGSSLGGLGTLEQISRRLKARYVAYYHLTELSGARTSGFGARTTGQASVNLRVYDRERGGLVWAHRVTETSIKSGTRFALQPRVDQALLNALRAALAPFVEEGLMKTVRPDDTLLDLPG